VAAGRSLPGGSAALAAASRAIAAALLGAALASGAAQAHGAAGGAVALAGDPAPLITDAQRAMLGLKFGPDAPVDFFRAKDGRFYIDSAGSLGAPDGPGRPAAWTIHVDPLLTRVLALGGDGPATGPRDVRTILTDHAEDCGRGRRRLAAGDPGGAACGRYFDRDYAGGGAYFRCPDGATSVYFYHGENHTAPDGTAGNGGWFGIGVGVFDASETRVARLPQMAVAGGAPSAQIVGMNVATLWRKAGGPPPQANPYNGVPSVVAGADGYLYLYHGNATFDPAYNPAACKPECLSVSRAPTAAFCRAAALGGPTAWRNFYRGGWTQPAVVGADSPLGYGAGGAFTPIVDRAVPGEYGGTVTFLPRHGLYLMVRLAAGGIDLRTSPDGLAWSPPAPLVAAPTQATPYGDAEQVVYPKIAVVTEAGGRETAVLTYVVATRGHFWRWAELMRQALSVD
jgi:hypothetical protein